jgi:energy-coupling factor transport system permease protein
MQTIYHEGSSFLHRLNPLSKFAIGLLLLAFMLATTDPWTPMVFSLFILVILFWLGRIPVPRLLRLLWPMLVIATFFALIYPFFARQSLVADTALLIQMGPIRIYQGGIDHGISTGFRVLALLVLSLPFSLTTDATDFVRALVQQWRLPYRIGYSTLAAFRFVPMLQMELSVIGAAHRVRGVNGTHGIQGAYERVRRYTVPFLATAIRQAERAALAMDGRAFGAFPDRTYYRRMQFQFVDWLFLLGAIGASVLLVFGLQRLGLLGPLTFLQIL